MLPGAGGPVRAVRPAHPPARGGPGGARAVPEVRGPGPVCIRSARGGPRRIHRQGRGSVGDPAGQRRSPKPTPGATLGTRAGKDGSRGEETGQRGGAQQGRRDPDADRSPDRGAIASPVRAARRTRAVERTAGPFSGSWRPGRSCRPRRRQDSSEAASLLHWAASATAAQRSLTWRSATPPAWSGARPPGHRSAGAQEAPTIGKRGMSVRPIPARSCRPSIPVETRCGPRDRAHADRADPGDCAGPTQLRLCPRCRVAPVRQPADPFGEPRDPLEVDGPHLPDRPGRRFRQPARSSAPSRAPAPSPPRARTRPDLPVTPEACPWRDARR